MGTTNRPRPVKHKDSPILATQGSSGAGIDRKRKIYQDINTENKLWKKEREKDYFFRAALAFFFGEPSATTSLILLRGSSMAFLPFFLGVLGASGTAVFADRVLRLGPPPAVSVSLPDNSTEADRPRLTMTVRLRSARTSGSSELSLLGAAG